MNKKFEMFLASAFGAGICVMIAYALGVPAWPKAGAALFGGVLGSGFLYKPREAVGILKESFRKTSTEITLELVQFAMLFICYLSAFLLSSLVFSRYVAPFFGLSVLEGIFVASFVSILVGGLLIILIITILETPNGFLCHFVGKKTDDSLVSLVKKVRNKLSDSILYHPVLILTVFLWPILAACFFVCSVVFAAVGLVDILRISVIAFVNAIVIMADSERLSVMAGAFTGGVWYLICYWGLLELLAPLFTAMFIGGTAGLASHGVAEVLKKKFKISKIPYAWECLKV